MSKQDYSDIRAAARALASVDDGAVTRDYQGYNGQDTKFGQRIASMPLDQWDSDIARDARRMLQTYSTQLKGFGIDANELTQVEEDEEDERDAQTKRDEARQKARNFARRPYLQIDNGIISVFNSYELRGGLYNAGFRFNKKSGKDAAWVGMLNAQTAKYLLNENKVTLSDEQRAELLMHYDTSDLDDVIMDVPMDGVYDVNSEGVNKLFIAVPWGRVPLSVIQSLPGRKYGGGDEYHGNKINYMSPSQDVLDMVSKFKLSISPDAEKLIASTIAIIAESSAVDTTMSVALDDVMRPYQKAGSAFMVKHVTALNADDMGLGKTIQSLSAVETVNAYPCIIVCPASLKLNWYHEIQRWLPHRTIAIVEGRNGNGKVAADITIVNYDILTDNLDYEIKTVKGKNGKPKEEIVFTGLGNLPEPKSLILDESHYIKEQTSRRTKAARYYGGRIPKGNPIFCLTGTPMLNRPKELIEQLLLLGYLKASKDDPGDLMTSGQFAFRFCGPKNEGFGWTFNGATNKSELAQWLRTTCMVRREKEDVLTELPKLQRVQQFMELSSKAKLHYSYLVDEARQYASKTSAEQLVFLTKVKEAIGLAKVDGAIAWADDFLQSGKQLIIFAYHKPVQEKLVEGLRNLGHSVTQIPGGQSARVTEEAKAKFQSGDSNVIVCSIKAAGVGHTLTASAYSFTVELNWSPGEHEQAEARNHRLGQTLPVTAYYYMADNTIDNYLFDMIEGKRGVIGAITDGHDNGEEAAILSELIAYMTGE